MTTTKWVIDPTHSEIGFKIKHMMFTNVSGKFQDFEAFAESEDDFFSDAQFEFTAKAYSLTTGNIERDKHLLSEDFLDILNFPKVEFKSTSYEKVNEDEYELTGDLTLHGVTKSIRLIAELAGIAKDPWGNTKAGITIKGKINRKDWGLNWNSALEAGGVLVGDEVKLNIDVQFTKN